SNVISDDEIQTLSGIDTKTNIWMLHKRAVREAILDHPLIKSMSMKRILPQTVEITIEEYDIIGYTVDDGKYYPVLTDGSVLKDYPMEYEGDRPFIVNFDKLEYMKKVTAGLDELPEHILQLISEISWEPTDNNKNKIIIYMNDGFIVHGTLRDFA